MTDGAKTPKRSSQTAVQGWMQPLFTTLCFTAQPLRLASKFHTIITWRSVFSRGFYPETQQRNKWMNEQQLSWNHSLLPRLPCLDQLWQHRNLKHNCIPHKLTSPTAKPHTDSSRALRGSGCNVSIHQESFLKEWSYCSTSRSTFAERGCTDKGRPSTLGLLTVLYWGALGK